MLNVNTIIKDKEKSMNRLMYLIGMVLMTSGHSYANEEDQNRIFYAEAGIGTVFIDDVSSKTYSQTFGNSVFASAQLTNKFEDATANTFEVGARISEKYGIRIGFAQSSFDAKFESASITGTVTVSGTAYSASAPITRADVTSTGITFDNDIKVQSLMIYKDFAEPTSAFLPFIAVGLGRADVSNANSKENAISFALGSNFDISDTVYAGLRYTVTTVDGPTDKLGIEYEDLSTSELRASIGLKF